MTLNLPNLKHQLLIHIDCFPTGELEIRYSYPYSRPHELREQVMRKSPRDISREVRDRIRALVGALESRIPIPIQARLPHAQITPTIRHGIATIVIQDQRPGRTPLARLYYYEEIQEIASIMERQVRMEPADFDSAERTAWNDLRSKIKAMAWADYTRLVGAHLFPPKPPKRKQAKTG